MDEFTALNNENEYEVSNGAQSATTSTKTPDKLTFREGAAQLEQIVNLLESNTLELEETLAQFERGVALVKTLRAQLSTAEQKRDDLMAKLEDVLDDVERDTTLS